MIAPWPFRISAFLDRFFLLAMDKCRCWEVVMRRRWNQFEYLLPNRNPDLGVVIVALVFSFWPMTDGTFFMLAWLHALHSTLMTSVIDRMIVWVVLHSLSSSHKVLFGMVHSPSSNTIDMTSAISISVVVAVWIGWLPWRLNWSCQLAFLRLPDEHQFPFSPFLSLRSSAACSSSCAICFGVLCTYKFCFFSWNCFFLYDSSM